jgi:predicted dehydrogenase/threonine dehydrogenase-like Zn-dependent dehydrogenase
MLQALIKKGKVILKEVPAPVVSQGGILIKVVNSCISAGTEVSAVQSSGRSLVRRALDQPEKVKQLLGMARAEGVRQAVTKLRGKLREEFPTGYSLSGIVLEVGEGIADVQPGDRVAAAGAGIANHAEYVDVPRNLVMRIPEGLDFAPASTVTLGGIAMQALRRAQVQLGEFAVVFGVGILGQLVAQMLLASGARVIAVDIEQKRLELCQSVGADLCLNARAMDPVTSLSHYTNGHGADVVLFCAATGDSKALSDAFAMCRKKGRVVMVGVWGNELRREDIYSKELDFLVATSYGPGRYDENYEHRGLDYPYAYVRWTENRNMEEYLRLLAKGKITVEPLIEHRYPIKEVEQAFSVLQSPERPLIVLLDYGQDLPENYSALVRRDCRAGDRIATQSVKADRVRVGVIGAGSFAVATHLPNLQSLKDKYEIRAICNRTGSKADALAKQFGAHYATTDYRAILDDPDIDLTIICTRHNLHGRMALESLKAGKHTFVEKPLCIELSELNAIKAFYGLHDVRASNQVNPSTKPLLMVGFNRRFSEYAREVKRHVQNRINPLLIHYRMNAGYVPMDHWIHSEEGGGRIIGEACHIIDLFSYLVGCPVKAYAGASLRPHTKSLSGLDNKSIVLEYEDGSVAALDYFAVASRQLPKEHLEVHFDEKSIIVDDYRSIHGYGMQVRDIRTKVPAKGQMEEMEELIKHLKGQKQGWPIPIESIVETTGLTFDLSK